MRNLKKLLAVIVSVCVLATFALPAFAAETTTLTDAQISEKLGAVKGDTSQGVTDEYLAKGTTRLQAAIIYLRMLNLEEEALAFESEDNFADAADVPWAGGRAILAYLKANPELGWQGVSETTFEPNGAASAQMMYKVALEALGYKQGTDFEWANVFAFAADKGLGKAADLAELTNNDMCTIVVEMLGIKVKDGDVTLIEKLVADGVIAEADAIEVGLIAAEPETLEVESISADNLKEMVLVFNKEVNKDTIKTDNIKVKKSGATVSGYSVALQDDNRTVIIKAAATKNFENQATYTVTVKDVKDADGVKIAEDTIEVVPFDAALPEVVGIKVTGPKSFDIEFSEPIKSAGTPSVSVKSGSMTVGVNNGGITGYESNKLSVPLYSALTDGKTYTVTIKGFEDFATYKMINYTTDIDYVADKSEITATVKEAEQTYVVVEFNKPVKFGSTPKDFFYHTFSAWKPLGVYSDEDMTTAVTTSAAVDKVWLKFAEGDGTGSGNYPIAEGETKLTIRETANDKKIKDNWSNEFLGATLTLTVSADKTAPSVSEIKVESPESGKSRLKVVFDEIVKFKTDNIEVLNADGTKNKDIRISISGSGKEYIVNLGTDLAGKSVFVTIKNVEDTALSPNKLVTYTATIDITDKTAPSVNKITKRIDSEEQALYVFFSEEMGDSALSKDNYFFSHTTNDVWKKIENEPTFYDGTKVVRIELTDTEKAYFTGSTYNAIVIMNVKDIADNNLLAKTTAFGAINDWNVAANAPKIDTVDDLPKAIATDKVEVTFDQYLTEVDPLAFKVNGEDVTGLELSTNSKGNSVVTLTVDETVKFGYDATHGSRAINIDTTTAKVANIFGVNVVSINYTGVIEDKIAPEIAKIGSTDDDDITTLDVDGDGKIDHIKIVFKEAMKFNYVSPSNFEVDDYDVLDAYASDAAPTSASDRTGADVKDAADIYIRVKEKDSTDTDVVPGVKIKGVLKDVAGNDYEVEDDFLDSVDGVAAVVKTQITAAGTLTANGTHVLAFSEALDDASKTAVKSAVDAAFTETGAATVTSAWDDAGTTLTVTIAGHAASPADDITLAAIANIAVTDLAGNTSVALDVQA